MSLLGLKMNTVWKIRGCILDCRKHKFTEDFSSHEIKKMLVTWGLNYFLAAESLSATSFQFATL